MAEEKPFEPTASRLAKARRDGDTARSQELCSVAAFAAALAATAWIVHPLAQQAAAALAAAVGGNPPLASLSRFVALVLAPVACSAAAACVCSVAQSGGLHMTAISFKIERLHPAENLRRIFSREAVVTVARASAAFVCAIGAAGAVIAGSVAGSPSGGAPALGAAAWSAALHGSFAACAAGFVFAGADFGIQFARWKRRLRMSHDDLRRDQKENDGDPLARSRRRSLHRRISAAGVQRVRAAAFVVTNPTHLAVALEYRPPEVAVPRVLVKAADATALRVRELAGELRIPIVENVPLARALYSSVRAGEYIPQETYVAVAEIVAALTKSGVLG